MLRVAYVKNRIGTLEKMAAGQDVYHLQSEVQAGISIILETGV